LSGTLKRLISPARTVVMSASDDHQKLVDQTIAQFARRSVACIDFEKHVGEARTKRPDLWLPDFHALVEVKTFAPQKREIEEEQRIAKELNEGQASAYWHPLFVERFKDQLKSARRKFREYPTHSTIVLFYYLHSFIFEQTPEELLRGQEYFEFVFPKDKPQQTVQYGFGYKDRQLRRDLNQEIGAVVFDIGQNAFRVFYNHFTDKIRRIDKRIFNLPEDEHIEYVDNPVSPQFIRLDSQ
jgi:hypothetical protein